MIDFLKESTFAVNDVIQSARLVLKKYYFSIVGLCLIIFLIPTLSTILSESLQDINPIFKFLFLILFVLSFLACQLAIIKYIFSALDKEENEVSFSKATPTTKEVGSFFLASLFFLLCCFAILATCYVILFPIVWFEAGGVYAIADIANSFAGVVIFIASIRISFFPFFIIDRQVPPLRALRLSLAITRGNFVKLLILLSFFAIFNALYFFLDDNGYSILSLVILFVNTFFVLPLSSISLAIAYRTMMSEYTGDEDPDVMDNII